MINIYFTFVLSKFYKSNKSVSNAKKLSNKKQNSMEIIEKSQPTWPLSWRERMDLMEVGESYPVDDKVVKSVRYIASKHFHSPRANSPKRFTVRLHGLNGEKKEYRLWRKNDEGG